MDVIVNREFFIDSMSFIGFSSSMFIKYESMFKGTRFDKKKSKRIAKLVILILWIVIIGTDLVDPIHRRLIEEENEDEKRLWCMVSYTSPPFANIQFNDYPNYEKNLVKKRISKLNEITLKSYAQKFVNINIYLSVQLS